MIWQEINKVCTIPKNRRTAIDLVDDQLFEDKFFKVPTHISDWLSEHLNLSDSRMMDFGCGDGLIALGVALNFKPREIVGVDLGVEYVHCLPIAKKKIGLVRLPPNLKFRKIKLGEVTPLSEKYDCIYSWSVGEHIDKEMLVPVVKKLKNALRPGGIKFLQVAPLFYSAYGSHLREFIAEPWAHLLRKPNDLQREVFGKDGIVLRSHRQKRLDRYKRESAWNCYITLNRVTAEDLINLFEDNGFVLLRQYRTFDEEMPCAGLEKDFSENILRTNQVVLLFQNPA